MFRGNPGARVTASHSYDQVVGALRDFFERLGPLPRDVNPDFRHHLDGKGSNEACGRRACAKDFGVSSEKMAREAFGHLTPARIADADEKKFFPSGVKGGPHPISS
jgi:hypothetical protein